jgi:hypothetical protein
MIKLRWKEEKLQSRSFVGKRQTNVLHLASIFAQDRNQLGSREAKRKKCEKIKAEKQGGEWVAAT